MRAHKPGGLRQRKKCLRERGAGSIYSTAHDMATPQSGVQYIDKQDYNGRSVDRQVPGGNLIYFVQEGNRPPAIILIYPIPTHR